MYIKAVPLDLALWLLKKLVQPFCQILQQSAYGIMESKKGTLVEEPTCNINSVLRTSSSFWIV